MLTLKRQGLWRIAGALGAALALFLFTMPYGHTTASHKNRLHNQSSEGQTRHTLPAADVLIDAGHGGIDGGTHNGDILEKDINLAISRKLYLILKSKGVVAVLNRTGDYALSDENRRRASRHQRDLSQRGGLAEEIEAGIFVSVHVNWSKRSAMRGPIVLHQKEARSSLLAHLIQDAMNRHQRTNLQPEGGGKFYVLKRVDIPSVIVETGFLSNKQDLEMLTSHSGQTAVANSIASGIIAYRALSP